MSISAKDIEAAEAADEAKTRRRRRKKRPAMHVSGKGVFKLQELAKKPKRRRR